MALRMTRIDPSKNMARFYEIDVQAGLFGDVSVTRYWGRIGSQGQALEHWFTDEETALETSTRVSRQKTGRGYKALPSPVPIAGC